MNIIICGVADDRENIVSCLPNQCSIIGYTDIISKFRNFKNFDYVPYIPISSIRQMSLDYIVIAYSRDDDIQKALEEMKNADIPKIAIIEYHKFKDNVFVNTMKTFLNIQHKFKGLLFGMSHSQCAIQMHRLHNDVYKFSSPSMDLFCHFQILKNIYEQKPDKLSEVSNFIFELPYYVFNFDLSLSNNIALQRLYFFEMLGNYHHYGEREEQIDNIKQFKNFLNVFKCNEKEMAYTYNLEMSSIPYMDFSHKLYRCLYSYLSRWINAWHIVSMEKNVWSNHYQKTIDENISIWHSILELVYKITPNARVTVLVSPFNPIFIRSHWKIIEEKRNMFYDIINQSPYHIDLIDHFSLYRKSRIFADHCHLTLKAGIAYTEYLNQCFDKIS